MMRQGHNYHHHRSLRACRQTDRRTNAGIRPTYSPGRR